VVDGVNVFLWQDNNAVIGTGVTARPQEDLRISENARHIMFMKRKVALKRKK
jgi:hypothetical protein